ncbi:dolichyl-phosphate beta-glucosyltransferase [Fonsecaea nubica]|uniref:Dolichyl-phosphate beta-glucosyltransferase n=1 Tax=Fonsecaea nubica TaxID=856822 RepID=A0A178CKT8_9EURO|nr:dolichyl-phosphate beta-glucosyltransferase [Fonsecaea nubica]OAL29712.1 dolichyl-phosphate beta-glucosyltransferase [Fonsecaea nubica]
MLWDKKTESIVSKESSEIIRMLYTECDQHAGASTPSSARCSWSSSSHISNAGFQQPFTTTVSATGDSELIRLTGVDFFSGAVLIEKLVAPAVAMTHYNTRFSGVTAADMREVANRESLGSLEKRHRDKVAVPTPRFSVVASDEAVGSNSSWLIGLPLMVPLWHTSGLETDCDRFSISLIWYPHF